MSLRVIHPRFDWSKVKWGGPKDRVAEACSYCGDKLPEDGVPLRLWKKDGSAAVFCDLCSEPIFGMRLAPP